LRMVTFSYRATAAPKVFSKDFHKAFELRQVFDYKAFEPSSLEVAEMVLPKANHFVAAVKKYLLQ
jgi:hypothetical protein